MGPEQPQPRRRQRSAAERFLGSRDGRMPQIDQEPPGAIVSAAWVNYSKTCPSVVHISLRQSIFRSEAHRAQHSIQGLSALWKTSVRWAVGGSISTGSEHGRRLTPPRGVGADSRLRPLKLYDLPRRAE